MRERIKQFICVAPRLLVWCNPASPKQEGSASGHWNKIYNIFTFAFMSDHYEKQARKISLLLYTKLLDHISQQIQWLIECDILRCLELKWRALPKSNILWEWKTSLQLRMGMRKRSRYECDWLDCEVEKNWLYVPINWKRPREMNKARVPCLA